MVETEFSLMRFDGDAERAEGSTRGCSRSPQPTSPTASAGRSRARRTSTIDQIVVKPVAQASTTVASRK